MADISQLKPLKSSAFRALTNSDKANLQDLCQRASDYFELVQSQPDINHAADNMFIALPEGKLYSDKYLLGIFELKSDKLIAVIDLIRNYPTPEEWCLGLMLIDPSYRKQGLGRQIYESLANWCKESGANWLRILVLQENAKAVSFWQKQGFIELEPELPRYGHENKNTIVMRHKLT